jgi:hypothetical protein
MIARLVLVVTTVLSAVAWADATPLQRQEDERLHRAVDECYIGHADEVKAAIAGGADVKAVMTAYRLSYLVERAAQSVSKDGYRDCFAALQFVLEAGADPNVWEPTDTFAMGATIQGPRAKEVKQLLEKYGAVDYRKEAQDCAAHKARLSSSNPHLRARSRSKLLGYPCDDFEGAGGHYVGADVARIREAPDAKAPVITLKRINAPLIIDEVSGSWSRVVSHLMRPVGWVSTEALRKKPTTPDDARTELARAMEAGNLHVAVTWAERLRALSPQRTEDLQLALKAFEAAGDKAKSDGVTKVLAGDATIYLAQCFNPDGAQVLATFHRADGLRPLKGSLKSLSSWVGAASWFTVGMQSGVATAKPIADTSSTYFEESVRTYDDPPTKVTKSEYIQIAGGCDEQNDVIATAPFIRVAGDRQAPKQELEFKLGEATHRIRVEPVAKKGRKLVRLSHLSEGGKTVDVLLETTERWY